MVSIFAVAKIAMPRHVILGIDERHLLTQRTTWDAGNPGAKIVEAIGPSRETSLLARWGGKNVPRYSMVIEFEAAEALTGTIPVPSDWQQVP